MTAETFLEKFDQFADAPNPVAKMRTLILGLAVQGRIVPQIRSESNVDADDLFNSDILSGPIPIPETWTWVRLGQLGAFINGDRSKNYPSKEFRVTSGIPFINAGHLVDGDVSLDKMDYITEEHFDLLGGGKVARGDVLYCLRGSLGKSAVVTRLDRGAIASSLLIIRPCARITARYLYIYLASPLGVLAISKYDNGSAQPNLSAANVKRYLVPLPPLAEQSRIVAKVDELMALCDRLEAQQQERESRQAEIIRASLARFIDAPTPANLDFLFHKSYDITPADLRKSILSLAVQGKLVPQDSQDAPISELLRQVTEQRARLVSTGSLRSTKACRLFAKDEAPHPIPDSWVWTMLGEITDVGTGSTPSRTQPTFWTNGTIPWVTSGSTSQSSITEGDEFVTPEAVKAHRLRIYPVGTLLVALYGQGKTRGQVAALEIPATINQACAAVCPLDGIPSMQEYLMLVLTKQYEEMRLQSAGGAQPNLNVQKIKEVLIPLPPLAEQRRIVDKVAELMILVDQLEEHVSKSRQVGTKLLEAVVAELVA